MKTLAVIFMLLLSSCSLLTPNIKTVVTWHNGEQTVVESKSDSLIKLEKEGEVLIVDNRGRPGVIEQFFAGLLLKTDRRQDNSRIR